MSANSIIYFKVEIIFGNTFFQACYIFIVLKRILLLSRNNFYYPSFYYSLTQPEQFPKPEQTTINKYFTLITSK